MSSPVVTTPLSDSPLKRSGFSFPLPEAMPLGVNQLQIDWWKSEYRQAVIGLRTSQAELSASRRFHQGSLEREKQLQQRIEELEAFFVLWG